MTDGEWNAIEKIAAKTGMGDGEYLRVSALGKTIYQVEELKPILHELKGIGRNLNQLLILAHEGRIQRVDLSGVTAALETIYSALTELMTLESR